MIGPALVVFACMNATMAENVAIAHLKEAEVALDQGDVLTARELAEGVLEVNPFAEEDPLRDRANRLKTLSYVRDPLASPEDLDRAVQNLRSRIRRTSQSGLPTENARPPAADPVDIQMRSPRDPVLEADLGEALDRVDHHDEAYDVLVPLADRDLIGSAYAYAALARVARARGDRPHATMAETRCARMAVRPSVCRSGYPPRPFLRGRPMDFAGASLVFIVAALLRVVRRSDPWSVTQPRRFALAIGFAGMFVFFLANLRLGYPAAIFTLFVLLALALWQRRLFFRLNATTK